MRQVRRILLAATAALFATAAIAAAAGPRTGVVVIETALGYQQAHAAGTGVVLDRRGVVLTNNHVIRGATTIRVRVNGRRFAATAVGYSLVDDVAVLRLKAGSGLATATFGQSSGVRPGQPVTAVGNAEGQGQLVVSRGKVVAVGRSIMVRDEQGDARKLTGLIQTDAELHPGDSGGPLLDSQGHVIGIDTAASTGFSFHSGSNEGYAIPIDRALTIARQIRAGRESVTVHVGPTAFLGIAVHASGFYQGGYNPAVRVDNVLSGGPADRAGIERGDIITTIDGTRVSSPGDVAELVVRHHPGETITLTRVDDAGNRSSARARLGVGPPQ